MNVRPHLVHVTSDALRWMTERYGTAQTATIVRSLVTQAGLDRSLGVTWSSGPGRGISVRGYVREEAVR